MEEFGLDEFLGELSPCLAVVGRCKIVVVVVGGLVGSVNGDFHLGRSGERAVSLEGLFVGGYDVGCQRYLESATEVVRFICRPLPRATRIFGDLLAAPPGC